MCRRLVRSRFAFRRGLRGEMGLQFPGKPLQEGLKEFGVQVLEGVAGQGLVGRERPFHQVLE
ncbi:hypothetical protein [Thermus thermophilus]|uniref:hypothetical protein n=1 Tax=Thermus thermophilus TaxID=274 RepID=UPI00217539B5|nr:hypothetical protein [Thermus thermophilus]